jgi:hypothetical protein
VNMFECKIVIACQFVSEKVLCMPLKIACMRFFHVFLVLCVRARLCVSE